jgi:50S ribosomal protein L16 3-hydroxylase
LGELLSEPKSQVWFEAQALPRQLRGVRLDRKTKMLYDDDFVFINGESWRCKGQDARHLHLLADQRFLPAAQVAKASVALKNLLKDWCAAGWLQSDQ